MAKKKEVILKLNGNEAAEPTEVTSGDVNIFYGRTLIAGLSEDSTARLETENTKVIADIGVEYTKPSGGEIELPNLTVNWSATQPLSWANMFNPMLSINNNEILEALAPPCKFAPVSYNGNYIFHLNIPSDTDAFIVTINNENVSYNNSRHAYKTDFTFNDFLTDITVTVTNKE